MGADTEARKAGGPPASRSLHWVVAEAIGNLAVTIVIMSILARLIGVEGFGLAALVVGIVQAFNLFVEGAFHDALIQFQADSDEAFDQAFWVVLAVAMTAVTTVGAAALLLDGRGREVALLALAGTASLPFTGAIGIYSARLRRKLAFGPVSRASMFGRLGGSLAAIGLAFGGVGALSLVLQYTLGTVLQCAYLVVSSRWLPAFARRFDVLAPLTRFAVVNALMHSLVAARLQLFSILVASGLGIAAAGLVNVAFRLTTTPHLVLATALNNFLLPPLARAINAPDRLLDEFRQASRLSAFAVPAFVGLALTASDLVAVLLGEDWIDAGPLVLLLALGAAAGFARLSSSFLLRAMGCLRYSAWNAALQLVIVVGGMLMIRPSRPTEAVALWLAASALQLPLSYAVVARHTGWSVPIQLAGVWPVLVATLAMTAAVLVAGGMAGELLHDVRGPHLWLLITKATVGVVVFVPAVLALDGELRRAVLGRR